MHAHHNASVPHAHRARTIISIGLLTVGLAACAFNQLYGVAQLGGDVVTGLLETNEEGDRVYVGTVYSGTHWDAVATVRAIDPSTGNQVGSAPTYGGAHRYRAIAEDTSDDTVWLLRDNGTLDHRSKNLGHLSSEAGVFTSPAGTLQRFCDLEQLPNGHFVATGVYEDAGGDWRGFWNYVQPHPAFPGSWYRSWTSYGLDPAATVDQSCPRVSHETDSSETVFLQPYRHYSGTTEHRVSRYESYSWDGGAPTDYYGLSYLGNFTTPVSAKWLVADLTAEFGAVVVARQHVTDLSDGYLEVFEQDTGVSEDTQTLERARAVDFSLTTPYDNTDASSLLWWGGQESETGSDFELGVFSFIE